MKHLIKIESTPNGVLGVRHAGLDQQYCEAGEQVILNWQPDAKWGLQEVHYTDDDGNITPVDLTPVKVDGMDVVVFTMPDDNITVGGTFKRFVLEDWTGDAAESPIFNGYIDATDQQRNTALANVSNQTANSTTGKMGYKVLDPTKTFAEQVTAENTIYEIRDVFDLGGTQETPVSITLPAGSTLKFNGGVIKNCTIVGNNTKLDGDIKFDLNTSFSGSFDVKQVHPTWFGAFSQATVTSAATYNSSTDQAPYFNKAIELLGCSKGELYIPEGYFVIKSPIDYTLNSIRINGNKNTSILAFGKPIDEQQSSPILFDLHSAYNNKKGGYIKNFRVASLSSYGYSGVFSKGIVFKNLWLSNGTIEDIDVYRAGIFINGGISDVSKVCNCHVTGLGYSFITPYDEDTYDNGSGLTNTIVDSEISSNYINATNAFETQQTFKRAVFGTGVTTSIIRNNYIDFWKYIFLGDTTYSTSYNNRVIFTNNTVDLVFSFIREDNYLRGFEISGNQFIRCSWNEAKNSSWGSYSVDTNVRNKTWIMFNNIIPNDTTVTNNIFIESDKILRLSTIYNNRKLLFDGNYDYTVPPGNKVNSYNIGDTEDDVDLKINNVIAYNNPNSFRTCNYLQIPSIRTYNYISFRERGIYDFGDEYYKYIYGSYTFGYTPAWNIKEWMSDLSCKDYRGYNIETKTFSINGTDKEFIVSMYSDKVVGCFSKDFKELFDNDYCLINNSTIYILIFDLNIEVFFTSKTHTGQVRYHFSHRNNAYQQASSYIMFFYDSNPTSGLYINRIIYNKTENKFKIYGYDGWVDYNGFIPLKKTGTSVQRPHPWFNNRFLVEGDTYNDTTLNKTLYLKDSKWVDENGFTPALSKGDTASRPTNLTADDFGFEYADSDLGKKIMWSGTTWVNLDGTALS